MNIRDRNMTRQAGMTLLELLVAFAIMAIALGMLYRAMGGSARSAGDIDRYQRAVVLAESVLALRDTVPEQGLRLGGESAGYQWLLRTAPYVTGISGPQISQLHEVSIVISWNDGDRVRDLVLTTLRPQRRPVEQGLTR